MRLSYFSRDWAVPRGAITLAELHGLITRPEPTNLGKLTAAVAAAPTPDKGWELAQQQDRIAVGGLWTPGQGVTTRSCVLALRVHLDGKCNRQQAQALLLDSPLYDLLLLYAEPDQRALTLLLQARGQGWGVGWRYYQRLIEQHCRRQGLWVSPPSGGLSPEDLFFVWADPYAYLHSRLRLPVAA